MIPAPARATVLMFMSTGELTREATVVLEGTVLHQEVVQLDHLYTDTFIIVTGEVHKGSAKPGQIVVVRQIGGTTSGLSLHVAGMARFKLGEEALIFAKPASTGDDKRLTVVGAALGKYTIFGDDKGERRVRRDLSSASIANFGPKGQFQVSGATATLEKERPTLKELRVSISKEVTAEAPKPLKVGGGAK